MLVSVLVMALMATSSADSATTYGSVRAEQGNTGPGYAMHPLRLAVFGRDAQGRPQTTISQPPGYTPQQIRTYLGFPSTGGAGQTVAVVDAFHSPSLRSDVNHFSSHFKLPLTCGATHPPPCFTLKQLTPRNTGTNKGWATEEALDVEWVHAIAPMANIIVAEAVNNGINPLFAALERAKAHGAAVIGNSWGGFEFGNEKAFDGHCANLLAAVCVFASGDFGNPGFYPAYNPSAIAVGGTTLELDSSGNPVSGGESAWSCMFDCFGTGGSGGGQSAVEGKQSYQNAIAGAQRGIPDVSFDADVNTGVPIYASFNGVHHWYLAGGTSLSTQAWVGILAVADGERATASKLPLHASGFEAQNVLYGLSYPPLFDVTVGTNGQCGSVCTAGSNYDFVTGLGSPRSGIDTALAAAP